MKDLDIIDVVRTARTVGAVFDLEGKTHTFETKESLFEFATLIAEQENKRAFSMDNVHLRRLLDSSWQAGFKHGEASANGLKTLEASFFQDSLTDQEQTKELAKQAGLKLDLEGWVSNDPEDKYPECVFEKDLFKFAALIAHHERQKFLGPLKQMIDAIQLQSLPSGLRPKDPCLKP